jgi:hypothetical protein
VTARRGRNDSRKIRMHRDDERRSSLLLRDMQGAGADVLRSHSNDVAAPLAGVEQQCEREAGAGRHGMMMLESRDLFVTPTVMARGLAANCLYGMGRVVRAKADVDRMPHDGTQHAAKFVGGSGLVGNASHELDDVIAPQIRCALVTMLPA